MRRPSASSSAAGTRRLTMDMVLTGPDGAALPRARGSPTSSGASASATCSSTGSRSPARAGTGSSSPGPCAPASRPRSPSGMMDAHARVSGHLPARDARRRDRPGGAPRRVQALPRPRLEARARHRPLDRDDHDRASADRRGVRRRTARGHGLLDASARDLGRRAHVPVLPVLHLARARRRRGLGPGRARRVLRSPRGREPRQPSPSRPPNSARNPRHRPDLDQGPNTRLPLSLECRELGPEPE